MQMIHLKMLRYFCFIVYICSTVFCQDDLRCFLLRAGSVQNFFVNESLPVGSTIGTLNIGGNASEDGDIYLRLESTDVPVQIPPNSKKLILTEKLDKEGKIGRSHVEITVVCQKRNSNDLDTRIPVVIRVTDSNDNAPRFFNAPYFVNVSEATVVGTVILGDIAAADDDQNGPYSTVQYSIAPGPYSDKFAFESPISGALQLTGPLDYEEVSIFNLTIIAQDLGIPPQMSETYITVQVEDSDDQNPVFTKNRYMAFLPENPNEGTLLDIQPESLMAYDQDKGLRSPVIYHLAKDVENARYFSIDPKSGKVLISEAVPKEALQQPLVLSVVATQVDNPDRIASTILTISRRGPTSTQLQFVQRSYEAVVLESLPIGSLIAQTIINKNPSEDTSFSLSREGFDFFSVSPSGRITLRRGLDFENKQIYDIDVIVTDGNYNDTAALTVKVLNVNEWDPRFQYPEYQFHIEKDTLLPGDIIGRVVAGDGDRDTIDFSIKGKDASMFEINSKGEIGIKKVMNLNSTEAHIILVARDNGIPPRQTSVPVVIFIPERMVRSLPIEASSNFLLMIVFGCLVIVFFLIIACLTFYIHKNKKSVDDNKAALPTKMSQIVPNGNTVNSMSSASLQSKEITVVEQPEVNQVAYGNFARNCFGDDSLRGSNLSLRSQSKGDQNSTFRSRKISPFSNETSRNGSDLADSSSLNGSNGTTASTVTLENNVIQVKPLSSFDGTARANGGMPSTSKAENFKPFITRFAAVPQSNQWDNAAKSNGHSKSKILWPSSSIPKKVKKLSWEDELNEQTEMESSEVNVTSPYASHHDTPNLTVYF